MATSNADRRRTDVKRTAAVEIRRRAPAAVAADRPTAIAGGGNLVAAAAKLFWERGYTAATTRDIAGALGIRSASLYYHIGKKEDLLYTICTESLTNITRLADAAVRKAATSDEAVRLLIQNHVVSALDQRNEHAVMLFELRHLSARRGAAVRQLRDEYEALVRRVVSRGQRDGALRSDVTPKMLSLALLNLLNWTIFWYRPSGPLRPRKIADLLTEIFLEGAGKSRSRSSNGRRPASAAGRRTPRRAAPRF